MEDYKEKYEKALEKGREFYAKLGNTALKKEVEEIFPELAPSESDIIIGALKSGFKTLEKENNLKGLGGIKFERILAWLEKQGEKPADGKKRYFSDICVDADEFRNKIMEFLHKDKSLGLDESFWGKETVEQLKKFTDEGSKKMMEAMRKIVFAREPKYQDLVNEYCEAWKDIKEVPLSEKLAYYIGLLRMYNYLKKGE